MCQYKMADRLFPCAHLLNPTAATRRIRCSYKYATIVVCICNVIIILFLLQSSFGPYYKMRAAAPAASEELKYTREAEEFRRAMEPVDLIKRVKELQEESGSEQQRQGQRKVPRQKNASEISKRLKHLRTPADQKAIEEWRKRKLERTKKREINGTSTEKELTTGV